MSEPSLVHVDRAQIGKIFKDLERAYGGQSRLAMQQISIVMKGQVDDEYESEGHGKWPPLAEETLRRRRMRGRGAKILQDTGNASGSTTNVFGDDFAEAYSNVPYLIFHTSKKPRRVIPYRNPFDIDEDELLEQSADVVLAMVAK